MKKIFFQIVSILALLVFSISNVAAQEIDILNGGERILNFHSDIVVNSDSSLIVTETIEVVALGEQIKRGIYRDFPTKYKDDKGNKYQVDFKILRVSRDGLAEPYHTEKLNNGIRTYFGDADVYLAPGIYTYEFTYETNRQLGYFEDHDELYWNVTGNGWVFPIEQANAKVTLPNIINEIDIRTAAYTGPNGSMENFSFSKVTSSEAYFETTEVLNSYEGLSVVVGWPKGVVEEPSAATGLFYFFHDNIPWFLFALLLIYYSLAWFRSGRDPKSSAIIPQYEPPQSLTPAEMRYHSRMRFDEKVLVSAILSMAEKGFLNITQKTKLYHLEKTGNGEDKLSNEEKKAAEALFGLLNTCILDSSRSNILINAKHDLKELLKLKFKNQYFVHNYPLFFGGLFLSFWIFLSGSLIYAPEMLPLIIFGAIWLSGWLSAIVSMWNKAYDTWATSRASSIGLILFSIPFTFFLVLVLGFLASIATFTLILILILTFTTNFIFFFLLKRRTVEGRKLEDEIEGFKWFLSVTEKDRINFHNPPEQTPELFEKFLPYAFALGVDIKWAEQFSTMFEKIGIDEKTYHPNWFHPNTTYAGFGDFTNNFGKSFSSAISSASTPPGSSSGFGGGGGGGSGGGGGGGGGGGW